MHSEAVWRGPRPDPELSVEELADELFENHAILMDSVTDILVDVRVLAARRTAKDPIVEALATGLARLKAELAAHLGNETRLVLSRRMPGRGPGWTAVAPELRAEHDRLRQQAKALIGLATTPRHGPCTRAIAQRLERLRLDFEEDLFVEERIALPRILAVHIGA
ncbi:MULTISPECIES: hemerythrin domain-containing protein [unclassified Caulobacter]|jgi:iron-sulfur cluster repair protein YtfE (RIC family)|uniref:Hemerythrin-like domain-containing protein n=1 Tax=Caulobacter vibrioides TaxID=155892 RepID=A0A258DAZ1_CAUVI|nr:MULTISPECIES: hemerythrin domain-containing protein [unclassified Caulobacter]AZS19850.1 hypothetical protein CSW63_03820 [Caulobacter sp. FWC26]OYX04918.1 MAG: hypothetical protein B7Z12_05135 [Caulobacter vibrioides]